MKKQSQYPILACRPKSLAPAKRIRAARHASEVNPLNHAPVSNLGPARSPKHGALRLAVMTTNYWGLGGVHLTVSFLDRPTLELQRHIVAHMNAWDKTANVKFSLTASGGDVRIARVADGYWSYTGTEIHEIPMSQATMNLEGFTMNTPESEFRRVVRHEAGHTLGFPHEHMRRSLVKLIDDEAAFEYYRKSDGWSKAEVRAQVLTPIEEASIRATAFADPKSIMCYQIDGSLTTNGKPIPGGLDIDASDRRFIATIYPKRKRAKRG
jgi:hypothetical protein